jgi:hypothetical protein
MEPSTICVQCGSAVPAASAGLTGRGYVCNTCIAGTPQVVPNLRPSTDGWHYSPLTGVMYGKIPVGIIAVAIGALIYFAVR